MTRCEVLKFLLYIFMSVSTNIADELLCTQNFCNYYRLDPGCPGISPHCSINNATHSGEVLPSSTTCNCCETCLVYIPKDFECSLGGLVTTTQMANRCGYGLSCQSVNDTVATCQRMESPCHDDQDSWDQRRLAGTLGFMEPRPRCDGSGKYAPNKCIPGETCFCQDQDGNRIFGEALYRDSSQETGMNCACSRIHIDMETLIEANMKKPIGPRCIADGSFNPIQCSEDICFCVDTSTGEAILQTAINTTTTEISQMDCFDSNIHLSNITYKSLCEMEKVHQQIIIENSEKQGYAVVASKLVSCQPDGSYSSMQISDNRKICVDEDSVQIGNFGAILGSNAERTMNCNCARTLHLITQSELSFERPSCCSNGNYPPIQCRRGFCYCVNTNGIQVGKERQDTEVDQLACITDRWREC